MGAKDLVLPFTTCEFVLWVGSKYTHPHLFPAVSLPSGPLSWGAFHHVCYMQLIEDLSP